jgi:hypothetical protein
MMHSIQGDIKGSSEVIKEQIAEDLMHMTKPPKKQAAKPK